MDTLDNSKHRPQDSFGPSPLATLMSMGFILMEEALDRIASVNFTELIASITPDNYYKMGTKYTIKDLAEGLCAVRSDGDAKDLNRVLSAAFPEDDMEASGTFYAYARHTDKTRKREWKPFQRAEYEKLGIPIQPLKDFLEELETEIIGYVFKERFRTQYIANAARAIAYKDTGKDFGVTVGGQIVSFAKGSRAHENLEAAGVMDLWFEPVYAKKDPCWKVGDWVITSGFKYEYNGIPLRISKVETQDDVILYYVNAEDEVVYFSDDYILRRATGKEVDKYLISEAAKRYPIGTSYYDVPDGYKFEVKSKPYAYSPNICAYKKAIAVTEAGGFVYADGVWAKTVQTDIIIAGHKVSINKSNKKGKLQVSAGRKRYPASLIPVLHELLNVEGVNLDQHKKDIAELNSQYQKLKS